MSNKNEKIVVDGGDVDREAALQLASEDSVLMQDEFTAQVIRSGGKTADGRTIEDIGNFLADRRAVLERDPAISYGPKPKWDDLPPDAKGTPHNER